MLRKTIAINKKQGKQAALDNLFTKASPGTTQIGEENGSSKGISMQASIQGHGRSKDKMKMIDLIN